MSSTFSLPSHVDENLTASQSAERLVEYFSKISKEFTPIEDDTLPERVELRLACDPCKYPELAEHTVYENMRLVKKTDSVLGNIPASILQEFTSPVRAILSEAITTHEWPTAYKLEYHLPIKNIPNPLSEDDIRGIGLTNWVSKQLERCVLNWIWPYVKPHMDPDQMGGVPGCSVEHYIKMLHFILGNMDGDNDAVVMAVPVDYRKPFNQMLHSNMITIMSDLKPQIPTCAIRIIKSYLTQRSMCMHI